MFWKALNLNALFCVILTKFHLNVFLRVPLQYVCIGSGNGDKLHVSIRLAVRSNAKVVHFFRYQI